ncbi:MAG: ABC transporter ATP-binding protein [Burkholderiaceae bacterium]
MSEDQAAPALELTAITKRFGSLVANDQISLTLGRGEILALLGENGAGKSTLVSILFGHYVADGGDIRVFGAPLPAGDPAAALAAGVGMVHQHFTLAERLTVVENVIAGTAPLTRPSLALGAARRSLRALSERFGLAIEPDRQVAALTMGERQRVEILKALFRGARILILDEPTAVLTPQEGEALFATLGQFVAQGLSIIFISHKLNEVLRVADRIAVLRAGRLVATLARGEADRDRLAELMVGHALPDVARRAREHEPLRVRCRLSGASVRGDAERPALDHIDLALHAGQILGIAGVSGNGQQVLADVLFGVRALDAGSLEVDGRRLDADPRAVLAADVARIPEDRHAVGTIGDLPVWENAIIEQLRARSLSRPAWQAGLLRGARARAFARRLVERFDVRGLQAQGVATPTRALSGGNMQKLILGRALTGAPGTAGDEDASAPAVIIANQPTWGLDVGAVAAVHQRLIDAAACGSAVLLISEDLEEIFALADTIAVMHAGRLTDPRPAARWRMAEIGAAMSGAAASGATVSGATASGATVSGATASGATVSGAAAASSTADRAADGSVAP